MPGTVARIVRVGFEVRLDVATAAGEDVLVTVTRAQFTRLGLDVGSPVHLHVVPGATTMPADGRPRSEPELVDA